VVVIADSGRRVTVQVVPPESDSATAAQAMMAATHQYAEHDTDARVTKAETAEANSLDEVAARLARLPGNTGPQQAALICGWVGEAAAQFSDAPIQAFVPILVEHIVRGRIRDNRADRPARNR